MTEEAQSATVSDHERGYSTHSVATIEAALLTHPNSHLSVSLREGIVRLYVHDDPGFAVFELNDPRHFNTFSLDLARCMQLAVAHVRARGDVHATVLQGTGPHFSVGGNPYGALVDSTAFARLPEIARGCRLLYQGFLNLSSLGLLTLAAVHGSLVGGSVAAIMHIDHVIAELGTSIEHGNVVRGVCPLGMLSQTFSFALGHSTSRTLYLHNVKLSATDALYLGLVAEVRDGVAVTQQRAKTLARCAMQAPYWRNAIHRSCLPLDNTHLIDEAVAHDRSIRWSLAKRVFCDHRDR